MNTSEISKELQSFCDFYIARFNAIDIAGWNSCFVFPWAIVSNTELTSIEDEAAAEGLLKQFWDSLKSKGIKQTTIDTINACSVGSDGATMILGFRRLNAAGDTIQAGNVCYQMRRRGDHWKIATMVDAFNR